MRDKSAMRSRFGVWQVAFSVCRSGGCFRASWVNISLSEN
jgi:hypothetical protein